MCQLTHQPDHKHVFGAYKLCGLCSCGGFAESMSNTAKVDDRCLILIHSSVLRSVVWHLPALPRCIDRICVARSYDPFLSITPRFLINE